MFEDDSTNPPGMWNYLTVGDLYGLYTPDPDEEVEDPRFGGLPSAVIKALRDIRDIE